MKRNELINFTLLCTLLFFSLTLAASPTEQNDTAKSGTIACGGNYFNRLGGTERHTTTYVLRNIDSAIPIYIKAIRVYNAKGMLIGNYTTATLPVTRNSTLGPGNGKLIPHMSAQYSVSALIPTGPLPVDERPIQVHFDWKARTRVLMPEFVHVRVSRGFDIIANKTKKDRARHLFMCRHIQINGR